MRSEINAVCSALQCIAHLINISYFYTEQRNIIFLTLIIDAENFFFHFLEMIVFDFRINIKEFSIKIFNNISAYLIQNAGGKNNIIIQINVEITEFIAASTQSGDLFFHRMIIGGSIHSLFHHKRRNHFHFVTEIIFCRNYETLSKMSFHIKIKRNVAIQILKTIHRRFHHLTVISFENTISHTDATGKLNFTGFPFSCCGNILFIHTKI